MDKIVTEKWGTRVEEKEQVDKIVTEVGNKGRREGTGGSWWTR